MKDILLGWLIKSQYEITALDELIGCTEIMIGFIIVVFSYISANEYIINRRK